MAKADYTDDDDLSQGPGDGDMFGYPGQIRYIGDNKVIVERKLETWEDYPEWWTWAHEPRDFGDNDKSNPEENWRD